MKKINGYVNNIIGTIKYFDWNITNVWVENNCIYAERIRKNGDKITEGLYVGSDDNSQHVYNVYGELVYNMNFIGMLNNDNVLI